MHVEEAAADAMTLRPNRPGREPDGIAVREWWSNLEGYGRSLANALLSVNVNDPEGAVGRGKVGHRELLEDRQQPDGDTDRHLSAHSVATA